MSGESLTLILWATAFGALIFSLFFVTLLSYHWFRYAFNSKAAFTAMTLYASISATLLLIIFGTVMIAP